MISATFTTRSLAKTEQFNAWRDWYAPAFNLATHESPTEGFAATNTMWALDGFAVSRVSSPGYTIQRTKSDIRRSPVDHWALTLSKRSVSDVEASEISLEAPPGVPFFLSLGSEMRIVRPQQEERFQLLLSRDRFNRIGQILDGAIGTALNTPQGKLLADYVLLVERNLPNLPPESAARLSGAIEAMFAVCLAPSTDRREAAKHQIRVTLMARVRRAVYKHLRSPSLGPNTLCREAATSRTQLYRLLEGEGGVAHYIQRRRLSESFAILCDTSNNLHIGSIAETLCFANVSSFSRAFRREFGVRPSDVRAASLAGQAPVMAPKALAGPGTHRFVDCLCAS